MSPKILQKGRFLLRTGDLMKVDKQGTTINIALDGSIGETTPLFILPLKGYKKVVLDMNDVNSINSIGVKHWILWTLRIPSDCQVQMTHCPYVICSQANIVMGFLTKNMSLDSFRAPYACDACGTEVSQLLIRGQHYQYPTPESPAKINLPPKAVCPKCKTPTLEPDFLIEKTFKFLQS
jgi:hypothetical protein